MVSSVTPQDLSHDLAAHGKLVDVRSTAEFAIGHIPGALNVPMEQVEARTADIGREPILLICEAGTRAGIVAGWLAAGQPISVLAGGMAAWRKDGLPLVACAPCRWTLERQVRLGAGSIVLLATLLAVFVSSKWIFVAMFIGAGLTFAGATNICGMAVVLAGMPWNRNTSLGAADVTEVSARCRC